MKSRFGKYSVRLKLEVGHLNCANSLVILGHIFFFGGGGQTNAVHTK